MQGPTNVKFYTIILTTREEE